MKKSTKKFNAVYAVIGVCILAVASYGLYFLYNQYSDIKSGIIAPDSSQSAGPQTTSGPSQSAGVTENDETPGFSPTPTVDVIIPGTNAPVYFGTSSLIQLDMVNPSLAVDAILDKLNSEDFVSVTEGDFDAYEAERCYQVISNDEMSKISIKVLSSLNILDDLYKDILNLSYDKGAYVHGTEGTEAPKATPSSIEGQYSYLNVEIYII